MKRKILFCTVLASILAAPLFARSSSQREFSPNAIRAMQQIVKENALNQATKIAVNTRDSIEQLLHLIEEQHAEIQSLQVRPVQQKNAEFTFLNELGSILSSVEALQTKIKESIHR